ncbi:MAG: hypothetical protein ACTHLX_08510, partial [Candidatus Binatia bacterium]
EPPRKICCLANQANFLTISRIFQAKKTCAILAQVFFLVRLARLATVTASKQSEIQNCPDFPRQNANLSDPKPARRHSKIHAL